MRPHRPENPKEIFDKRVIDALNKDDGPHNGEAGDDKEGWVIDSNVCADGGTVLGFFDESQPQPYDNSRCVWYVDDPYVERPLVKTEESAIGFYALNGRVRFAEKPRRRNGFIRH